MKRPRSKRTPEPNHSAAGKAGIAVLFAIKHHWPGLPEPLYGRQFHMLDLTPFTNLKAASLVDELAMAIYRPPLARLRDRLGEVPKVLQTVILIIDFDSTLATQGVLGFLVNSTGMYVSETIAALKSIGAPLSAGVLEEIEGLMAGYGLTHAGLREIFKSAAGGQLASLSEVNRPELDQIAHGIRKASGWFTCVDSCEEPLRRLLADYVDGNRSAVFDALALSAA